MFRTTILLVVFVIQFVLFRRTMKWLSETRPANRKLRTAAIAVFVFFNLAFVAVMFIRPHFVEVPSWFEFVGVYPFYIWYAATFFIGLFILLATIIKLPFKIIYWVSTRFRRVRERFHLVRQKPAYQSFDVSRRTFLRRSMYGLTAMSFAGSAYGTLIEKSEHDITTAEFYIPSLPPTLDGFSIGLATDIHSSLFMTKGDMDKYVSLLNGMGVDLIAVVGDFVNGLNEEVYPFAESFSNLKAPHGVYGVMGNHDFYAPNPELVARNVNDCGVRLLRDDHVTITKNGAQLHLLGIDDVGSPRRAQDKMEAARSHQVLVGPRVLLCHRPYFLPQAAEENIDLMLSGHTHGGQIVLGSFGNVIITPAALASPYISGTYRHGNTAMYVSRGIGTVGVPVRLNCPPELTRIVLRSGTPKIGT